MGTIDATGQGNGRFDSVFERIRNDVIAHIANAMPTEAVEWFHCVRCSEEYFDDGPSVLTVFDGRRNLDFNVSDGKWNNIMPVADFMYILRGRTLSDDEYFKATLLEWCIKLLQASRSYVYPNDKPNKKRKQQCWFAGDDIVLKDSLWLDAVMYYLLKKYFYTEAYYVDLLELFHETTFQTEMGHLVNFVTASKDHFDLNKFSLQKHALITRNRITSFYLPVALAMCVCGVPESYTLRGCDFYPYTTARSILLQLGEYSQIQADYLNYVGAVGEVSKAGSDIKERKCSWCINVALVVSSPRQCKVLEDNFEKMDPDKEMRVKEIFETIGLKEQYRAYEARLKERIEALIVEIPEPEGNVDGGMLKREVFSGFFDKIYERTKQETC